MRAKNKLGPPRGRVRAFRVLPCGLRVPATPRRRNLIMYSWGTIVGNLLLAADRGYRVAGMYLEFENVASPGDPAAPPSYGRGDGIEYYGDLGLSADRDYVRVALISGTLESSDEASFPEGNRPVFFAQSQGAVAGVHAKEFSESANSLVFGAALVAMRDEADSSQDLILSRFYFAEAEQQPKLSTSEVGVEWEITLG